MSLFLNDELQGTSPKTANGISFDKTGTNLKSTDVQSAIAETDAKIGSTTISSIGDGTVTGAISTVNSNLLALGVTKIEIVTKGLTPSTTSRQYIETGISASAKIVIPVCIAPSSNADACLKDLAMQGNTILRFTASHANLSYTVKFLCIY